jgi:hypothetical protein
MGSIGNEYGSSVHEFEGTRFSLAATDAGDRLLIRGAEAAGVGFEGEPAGGGTLSCPTTNANAALLRRHFPWLAPSSFRGRPHSLGLGDRLGLASPGHIRAVKGRGVFPVLAQQSMRELTLTGRTYDDVLAAATWAVFREDWRGGWGADGDHLKTPAEIAMALEAGFTMITLDCSEHIDNRAAALSDADAVAAWASFSAGLRADLERRYLAKPFVLSDGTAISFTAATLARTALVYLRAIHYAIEIWRTRIATWRRPVDFELSIDETLTSTSPEAHFFVAAELASAGVGIANMAPRFAGEFQKGIDYIGDRSVFRAEYAVHASIARHFGYRISVHSGSDKFSVFPEVGRLSKEGFHVKTAGTNWLEAVRVIARHAPSLYRDMHAFSLEKLAEARKYYHIKGDPANVAPLSALSDDRLPGLMDLDDARQILHISYGTLLSARDDFGAPLFRDRILGTLRRFEAEYAAGLAAHIGRHLDALGL